MASSTSSLKDYVKALGGTQALSRVLVANNGIAAVKCIRSIRRWAYDTLGNERAVQFIVMTTPEDLRANAEYIRMADEFVEVPGGSNNNNYANVRLIVEKAQAVRADAVWAGWGHASEYPTLPDTLKANNIKFIGPSGAAMRALGDKIGSTIIAQSAGVPTIAWNGADVRVKYATEGLSQALIDSASVKSVAEAASAAERVGFPLMIKASEGGGGKGIRKVTDMADLPAAFEAVAGEVPGSPIFLMRLVSAARHLEVQLLADEYGTAISLAGRDCSVQRRHQKIIEEGPVLAAPPSVWRRMEAAAVALAEEVGYANTGTVEYLFADRAATGEVPADAPESERYTFAFLELNPRLQVEHPVTEMITGVNLPAAQLHVAMGIPLHRIPDIRRLYGCAPTGDSVIDFATAQQCLPGGHVIAARITAENPDSGFQPTSGAVEELNFRSIPDVWGYFSVDGTGRVHEFADSQIGHLFAWGADREDARRKMVMVLKEVSIRGDIHTTVEYLADLLQTADFRANAIHTQWLDRRISSNLTPTKPPAILIAVLGAVWTAQGEFKARRAEYVACVKRGQLPSPDLLSLHCSPELIYDDVKFGFQASALSPTSMEVSIGGTAADVHLRELADSGMLVVVGGKSHVVYGQEEASGLRLMVDGATCMFTEEYDPTQLRASQTGKLAKCMVADGAHVAKGTAYAQVEVMKMYLPLLAPEAGHIHFAKAEGSILAPGDLIAALDLDDPSAVLKSTPFTGTLPQAWLELRGEGVRATTLHAAGTDAASGGAGKAQGAASPTPARHAHPRTAQQLMRSATETLRAALRGFEVSRPALANAWSDRDAAFSDPSLALEELEDVFAVAASRLPYEVHDGLQGVIARHKAKVAAHLGEEGAVTVMDMALPEHMRVRALGAHQVPELQLGEVLAVLDSGKPADMDSTAYAALVQPIRACAERFQRGVLGADRADLLEMLQEYLSVETRWHRIGSSGSRGAAEEVMRDMRSQWIDGGSTDAGLDDIFMTFCAHEHLRARNTVLLGALERVGALLERQKVEESAASGSAAAGGLLSKEDQAERLLHSLAELRGSAYAEVALEARQLLIRAQQPSVLQRLMSVETVLKQAELSRRGDGSAGDVLPTTPSESAGEASPQQAGDTEATDPLVSLVNQEQPMADVLMMYFGAAATALRRHAVEVYVRRLYRAYSISSLYVNDVQPAPGAAHQVPHFPMAVWRFASTSTAGDSSEDEGVPAAVIAALTGTAPPSGKGAVHPPQAMPLPSVAAPVMPGAHGGLKALPSSTPGAAKALIPSDSYDDLAAAVAADQRRGFPRSFTDSPFVDGDSTSALSTHDADVPAAPAPPRVHVEGVAPKASRIGLLTVHRCLADFDAAAEAVLTAARSAIASGAAAGDHRHVLHVVLLQSPDAPSQSEGSSVSTDRQRRGRAETASTLTGDGVEGLPEDENDASVVAALTVSVQRLRGLLTEAGFRRLTFLVPHAKQGSLFGAVDGLSAALAAGKAPSDALGTMKQPESPHIFTFRAATDFAEDPIVRHIEPPLSGYLELRRLSNFHIRLVPTPNVSVHVYEAVPRAGKGRLPRGTPKKRFFVRAIVRQTARLSTVKDKLSQFPGPERVFVECLNALDVAMGDSLKDTSAPVGNSHIFMNMLPVAVVHQEYITQVIKLLAKRYAARLRRLRVSQAEFKIMAAYPPGSTPVPIRLISSSPTGYVLRVATYVEASAASGGTPVFMSVGRSSSSYAAVQASPRTVAPAVRSRGLLAPIPGSALDVALRQKGMASSHASGGAAAPSAGGDMTVGGELDGQPVTQPYPIASQFEGKRSLAAAMSDTLYVYDFLELFEKALEMQWAATTAAHSPSKSPSVDDDDTGSASGHSVGGGLDTSSVGAASTSQPSRPARVMQVTELVLRKRRSPHYSGTAPQPSKLRSAPSEIFSNELGPSAATQQAWRAPPKDSAASVSSGGAAADLSVAAATGADLDAALPGTSVDREDFELVEMQRPPGQNDIGMVAWVLTLFTPEYPAESGGRKVVVIANDITHRAGSFGTMEDRLFAEASRYARERGLPRLYLAANSGARIGLADDVKAAFRVAWKDPSDVSKGFDYLYLVPEDYNRLSALGAVAATARTLPSGEVRWVLTDIIGQAADIGVENLRGSGAIAGETSRAYNSSFTLTYVTGRSVGIGAYLVRLGHRVIQKEGSAPILLTGYQALNKLIGREVYASNLQLGGPRVMHANGVSHQVVHNDFDGVQAILRWLAFVPERVGAPLPISAMVKQESVDRAVAAKPPPDGAYDPRALLSGHTDEAGSQVPGFFDEGSFVECMSGWARTVITARARLGGIPAGIIVPEVRSVTSTTPADPATPSSQETQVQQAGQVWYPDSAFKTAQAIRDFQLEGLPLFIFANWRGFSGGQRDMFDQVLKFGAYIVDALVAYTQPVFVYILPRGELRGGAWVVVDPAINPDHMEMYAATSARGGILEPSGVASIKFREPDMRSALHRMDPQLQELMKQYSAARAAPSGSSEAGAASQLKAQLQARETLLMSAFLPAAHAFADLHDTPGRMMAKGVISGVVPWHSARTFFYWRLRRRLATSAMAKQLQGAMAGTDFASALNRVKMWYLDAAASDGFAVSKAHIARSLWQDDLRVLRWLVEHKDALEGQVLLARREAVLDQVLALGKEDPMAVVSGVLSMVQSLPAEHRDAVVGALRRGVVFSSQPAAGHPYIPRDVAAIPPSPLLHGTGVPQVLSGGVPTLEGQAGAPEWQTSPPAF